MVFLGNEKAKNTLEKMRQSDRISHAILLCGEKGLGKKTFARLIAQTILCEENNAPCHECPNCVKIKNGTHVDVTEIADCTRPASFSVERVRDIKQKAYISPNEARKRVFILANADCMTDAAQNALLKIIEEPPETAVFILTAQNREKLLTTVLSRCVTIPVVPVSDEVAKARVKELCPNVENTTLNALSKVFGGNIGALKDAVNDPKAIETLEKANSLLGSLARQDKYSTLVALSTFSSGAAATPVLENAIFILSKSVAGESNPILDAVPLEIRVYWLSQFISALSDIGKNANLMILMTHLCINLYEQTF